MGVGPSRDRLGGSGRGGSSGEGNCKSSTSLSQLHRKLCSSSATAMAAAAADGAPRTNTGRTASLIDLQGRLPTVATPCLPDLPAVDVLPHNQQAQHLRTGMWNAPQQ